MGKGKWKTVAIIAVIVFAGLALGSGAIKAGWTEIKDWWSDTFQEQIVDDDAGTHVYIPGV